MQKCRGRRNSLCENAGSAGSACSPVITPVFKTGGRHLAMSPVGSTPTRFRQLVRSFAVAQDFGSRLPVVSWRRLLHAC